MANRRVYASRPTHPLDNNDRIRRVIDEFTSGYKLLETIERGVTIFGSARTQEGEPLYNEARQLGKKLAETGYTVVTGGGPGIMEAASRGAIEGGGRAVAFNIELEKEQGNPYVTESMIFYYFFVRKVMLASAGHAYVYFPGGFGTLDEFFEISTLVSTHKLHQDVPIILYDRAYWQKLLQWLRNTVVERYHGFDPEEFAMWHMSDSVVDAAEVIARCSGRMGVCRY